MAGHDAVVHFAAESHVDRSIAGPDDFINTNCFGTNIVMDTARRLEIGRVVHIGTDEVYGSVEVGSSKETDPLEPRSPYSASKAGSDLIALSYHHTYGLPVVVTRCTNNFGPFQYPEKAIPLFTTNLLDGAPIPLYGDGLNERDWIYVDDHCAGVHLALHEGVAGRDLQHRRRQRDAEPRARRQAARADRPRRGARGVRRPTASATTGATRSTSPRSPRSAGGGSARSTKRSPRPSSGTATNRWWWEPLKAARMKILVTGAGGQVGRGARRRARAARSDRVHARRSRRRRPRLPCSARSRRARPDAIVHCASWTNVDGCESDPDRAFRDNALANRNVMEAARRVGAYVVALSTDYVFDGEKDIAVPRVGHAEPASRSTARRSSRASSRSIPTARSCARRGCAGGTARTW